MNPLLAYLMKMAGGQQGQGPPPAQPYPPPQPPPAQLSQQDKYDMAYQDAPVNGGYPFVPNDPTKFGAPGDQANVYYDLMNRYIRHLAGR